MVNLCLTAGHSIAPSNAGNRNLVLPRPVQPILVLLPWSHVTMGAIPYRGADHGSGHCTVLLLSCQVGMKDLRQAEKTHHGFTVRNI